MARSRQHYTIDKILSHCRISKRTNCWIWQRGKNQQGYGVCIHDGKNWLVHRLVCLLNRTENWEYLDHNVVLHQCDNPSCCNPEHLQIGTHDENLRDAKHKGRWNTFNRGPADKKLRKLNRRIMQRSTQKRKYTKR
jgi:hypothetical protein